MPKFDTVALFALVFVCLAERPAEAYLSPTNASLMLQLLLGGFAAFSIVVKVFWARIKDARRRNDQ